MSRRGTTERIDRLLQLQDPEWFAFEDADVRSESRDTEEPRPARLPPKLYKIGDVIQYSGLSRQTIHNYTMLGLITEESRTPSGHRLYGESVFPRLERIQDLKRRMSLREVREILEKGEE